MTPAPLHTTWTGKHTPRHAALATAVRILIQLDQLNKVGNLSLSFVQQRKRMQQEVEKWAGTDDVYALGIMAPLYALGEIKS